MRAHQIVGAIHDDIGRRDGPHLDLRNRDLVCQLFFGQSLDDIFADLLLDQRTVVGTQADLDLLGEVNETMLVGSLCALGGGIPLPIRNLLTSFVDEFAKHVPGARTPDVV